MKNETEFLQGAFDSYKGTLSQDMDQRWKKKEEELKLEYEEIKQDALHELSMNVIWFYLCIVLYIRQSVWVL